MSNLTRIRRALAVLVALLLLNASLSFHNVWPTPGIAWSGALSIEFVVLVVLLAVWHARWRGPSNRALRVLTAVWLALIVGRYAAVTAPALWGRELNFYWDLRFLPDVLSLLARAARPWLVLAAGAVVLAAAAVTFLLVSWSIGRVSEAAADRRLLKPIVGVGSLVIVLFLLQQAAPELPLPLPFTPPVSAMYARQARFVASALRGSQRLPPSPSMTTELSRVKGADVLLLFIESYGVVAFERPSFNARLEPGRQELLNAIRDSGFGVASTFALSPTFGGSSWFAHISLLSGLHIGDPDANALLMTEHRDTLPKAFVRNGYRSIAMLPGIWSPWPEGAFYGFDDIYNAERLKYRGPPFGWFTIPDQYVMAKLDQLEVDKTSRPPLFVFFPTISTHTPFAPTPPYQPDWRRMLTDLPYDERELERVYDRQPEWTNLGPSYVDSVAYVQQWLAGYLRRHANGDLVIIALGDHQPPALVTGESAPWAVPVHVITNRTAILERLEAHGFVNGLKPEGPANITIEGLLPVLLDAFGQ